MEQNPSDSNILVRIQRSALFNRRLAQKYDDFIFGADSDLQNLLEYVNDELNHLISIDPKGESLMPFQRFRIIKVSSHLLSLSEILNDIEKNVTPDEIEETNDLTEKQQLRKNLDENRIRLREGLRTHLPEFTAAIDSGISYITSKEILQRNKNAEDLSLRISDLTKQAEEMQEKSERVLSELAMLPTKVQVSNYSKLFETESENFRRTSKWWLLSIIGCLVGIVALPIAHILAIHNQTLASLPFDAIIQINVSKVLILTALFYGLSICNKNYKMNKHNEILNKHRKNALSSFQAFVESPTADESTKNAVLLEATKTIYGAQQTGYMNVDSDDSPMKIIDIINAMSGKKI